MGEDENYEQICRDNPSVKRGKATLHSLIPQSIIIKTLTSTGGAQENTQL